MKYTEKRKKLESYKKLKNKRNILRIKIEEFEYRAKSKAEKTTSAPLGEGVASSGGEKLSKQERYSERDEELKRLSNQLETVSKAMTAIETAISKIKNIDYQNAIYAHYILDYSDREYSLIAHFSEETARNHRRKGIKEIEF